MFVGGVRGVCGRRLSEVELNLMVFNVLGGRDTALQQPKPPAGHRDVASFPALYLLILRGEEERGG